MARRRAVVTGGSSGIGRATAVLLARHDHDVAIGYRSDVDGANQTKALVEEEGGKAVTFRLDHADPEDAARAIDRAVTDLGGVDVFVNNAGVNHRGKFLDESLADWQRLLAVDLTGPFACAQAVARRMVEQGAGGRIVNVTSVHELIPIDGGSAYCAAKGGLLMLTRVMALELAEHGITVNAVAPGETATPMNGVPEHVDAAAIDRPMIPVGRPGRAEEVAALIAHLASDAAAYITGSTLHIDGGLALMGAIPNQAYAGRI
ncbi:MULTISPECIES: SDR family oxidoreductase [unclassified Saccharothrix]|uniref:SDR family oxidoreductase n=1 Tax=unclassified Saccharothrix TaxID=2593673 RepID=UPI00307EE264